MGKIAIYIPNYMGADFLKKVNIPSECDCVVMDNCSSDESVSVCRDRGFICIENKMFVSRTQNWLRCIEHFKNSSYEWMKWLFVGDELCVDAYSKMLEAVRTASNAAIILFDYYIDTGKKKFLQSWACKFDEGLVSSVDARLSCVEKGAFAAPLGWMISKNCDFEHLNIDGYWWAADVLLFDQLMGKNSIFYHKTPIGVLQCQQRNTYKKNKRKIATYLETIDVIYGIFRECNAQYQIEHIDGEWFYHLMVSGVMDNINSFDNFLFVAKMFVRGLGKFILRKNGGDHNL